MFSLRSLSVLPILSLAACTTVPSQAEGFLADADKQAIVSGQNAENQQFPHQVLLQGLDWGFCGGTLIAEEWVVTAAHCVLGSDPSQVSVRSGSVDFHAGDITWIDRFIVHPGYDPSGDVENDIALVKLAAPTPTGVPIPLVTSLREADLLAAGELGTLLGWGRTDADVDAASDSLQYGDVAFLDQAACEDAWNAAVTPLQVCTQSTVANACNGDSGGPVLVAADYGWALAGVVSFFEGCDGDLPTVHTRVSAYLGWFASHGVEVELLGDVPADGRDVLDELGEGASRLTLTASLTPGATDTYTIEVPAGTVVSATTRSNIDTFGTLYHAANEALASDDDSGDDLNFAVTATSEGGVLTLAVRGYNAFVEGTYELILETTPAESEVPAGFDPWDRWPAQTHLETAFQTGGSERETFSRGLDQNETYVVRFELADPERALHLYALGDEDVQATLYDASGQLVDSNDDGGPGQNYAMTVSEPGVYYLEMQGYAGGAVDLSTFVFELDQTTNAGTEFLDYRSDDPRQWWPLTLSDSLATHQFVLPVAEATTIQVDQVGDATLTLFDEEGEVVAPTVVFGQIEFDVQPGTHTLVVDGEHGLNFVRL